MYIHNWIVLTIFTNIGRHQAKILFFLAIYTWKNKIKWQKEGMIEVKSESNV